MENFEKTCLKGIILSWVYWLRASQPGYDLKYSE